MGTGVGMGSAPDIGAVEPTGGSVGSEKEVAVGARVGVLVGRGVGVMVRMGIRVGVEVAGGRGVDVPMAVGSKVGVGRSVGGSGVDVGVGGSVGASVGVADGGSVGSETVEASVGKTRIDIGSPLTRNMPRTTPRLTNIMARIMIHSPRAISTPLYARQHHHVPPLYSNPVTHIAQIRRGARCHLALAGFFASADRSA